MNFNYTKSAIILLACVSVLRMVFLGEEAIYQGIATGIIIIPIMVIADLVSGLQSQRKQQKQQSSQEYAPLKRLP